MLYRKGKEGGGHGLMAVNGSSLYLGKWVSQINKMRKEQAWIGAPMDFMIALSIKWEVPPLFARKSWSCNTFHFHVQSNKNWI